MSISVHNASRALELVLFGWFSLNVATALRSIAVRSIEDIGEDLPVDVTEDLKKLGIITCNSPDDMLEWFSKIYKGLNY